jgi:hypothetical protein
MPHRNTLINTVHNNKTHHVRKSPQTTDDYIRILKGLDNREKLKIISVLTDSMLESQGEKRI